jgi:beta-phosphoglucomutase-like phosphatase (HAD superfamily)
MVRRVLPSIRESGHLLPSVSICGFLMTSIVLQIPDEPFAACIFDCDGTLVDSMPLHYEAWLAALRMHDFPADQFTLEMHHKVAGMPGVAIVQKLNEEFGHSMPLQAVEEERVRWYMEHHTEVRGIGPVVEFARRMHGTMPLSVASGSDRWIVEESLRIVGILELFPVIITPADVVRGKPAPDMFLLAAQRMGVRPEECLVFEDGYLGIQAAEAAGMRTVFVPSAVV